MTSAPPDLESAPSELVLDARYADVKENNAAKATLLTNEGCTVTGTQIRPAGMRIKVVLVHPKTQEELPVECLVIGVHPTEDRRWSLELRFAPPVVAARTRLTAYVDSILPPKPPPPPVYGPPAPTIQDWIYNALDADLQKNFAEAIRCVDEALAIDDNKADLHGLKGRLLSDGAGNVEDAMKHAKRALELRPKDPVFTALVKNLEPRVAKNAPKPVPLQPVPAIKGKKRREKRPERWPRVRRALRPLSMAVTLLVGAYAEWVYDLHTRSAAVPEIDPAPFLDLLPIERMWILDGRVYVRVNGSPGSPWRKLTDQRERIVKLAGTLRRDRPTISDLFVVDSRALVLATVRRDFIWVYAAPK